MISQIYILWKIPLIIATIIRFPLCAFWNNWKRSKPFHNSFVKLIWLSPVFFLFCLIILLFKVNPAMVFLILMASAALCQVEFLPCVIPPLRGQWVIYKRWQAGWRFSVAWCAVQAPGPAAGSHTDRVMLDWLDSLLGRLGPWRHRWYRSTRPVTS